VDPGGEGEVVAGVGALDVEAGRVVEHVGVAVRRAEQHRHPRPGRHLPAGQDPGGLHRPAGDLHRAVEPEHLLDGTVPARRRRAQRLPLLAVGVQQHDAVAEQVHGGLEARPEQQHHGGVQLPFGERLVVREADEPADQVVPRIPAQPREVLPQEGMHGAQRLLGRHVATEGQARVQGGGRGGAPVEEVLPAPRRHPQQVGDDEHRQLGGVGLDEVDRPAAEFERVEQGVGGPLDDRFEGGGGPRGEGPADQAAEPGVVRRVHHQHGRRLGHS